MSFLLGTKLPLPGLQTAKVWKLSKEFRIFIGETSLKPLLLHCCLFQLVDPDTLARCPSILFLGTPQSIRHLCDSLSVRLSWLSFRPCGSFWYLQPSGFWKVAPLPVHYYSRASALMVSYCHPWPVEEVTSELSDAGAPFISAFLMALVNEVFPHLPAPAPWNTTVSWGFSTVARALPSAFSFLLLPFVRTAQAFQCCSVVAIHFLQASKSHLSRDFVSPAGPCQGIKSIF